MKKNENNRVYPSAFGPNGGYCISFFTYNERCALSVKFFFLQHQIYLRQVTTTLVAAFVAGIEQI